jgi:CHAT domain
MAHRRILTGPLPPASRAVWWDRSFRETLPSSDRSGYLPSSWRRADPPRAVSTPPDLEAGVRSVVATNWRVGERSSVRLVGGLYPGWAEGKAVVDALRSAKVAAPGRSAPRGVGRVWRDGRSEGGGSAQEAGRTVGWWVGRGGVGKGRCGGGPDRHCHVMATEKVRVP